MKTTFFMMIAVMSISALAQTEISVSFPEQLEGLKKTKKFLGDRLAFHAGGKIFDDSLEMGISQPGKPYCTMNGSINEDNGGNYYRFSDFTKIEVTSKNSAKFRDPKSTVELWCHGIPESYMKKLSPDHLELMKVFSTVDLDLEVAVNNVKGYGRLTGVTDEPIPHAIIETRYNTEIVPCDEVMLLDGSKDSIQAGFSAFSSDLSKVVSVLAVGPTYARVQEEDSYSPSIDMKLSSLVPLLERSANHKKGDKVIVLENGQRMVGTIKALVGKDESDFKAFVEIVDGEEKLLKTSELIKVK